MSEFFLELFSEEIPSNLQKKLRDDLLENFQKSLARVGVLTGTKIETTICSLTEAKDEKGEEDKEKDEDGKNITEVSLFSALRACHRPRRRRFREVFARFLGENG